MTEQQVMDVVKTGKMDDFWKARKQLNRIKKMEEDCHILALARAYNLGIIHGKREERAKKREGK